MWTTAIGTALLTLTTTLAPLPAAVRWRSDCTAGPPYQCATLTVPLDHDAPHGRRIDLRLIKRAATGARIGTLFLHSGGPGEALTDTLPKLYTRIPAAVRERFDVVGFDQRGIGQSTAVQCFDTLADQQRVLASIPAGFPLGRDEERATEAAYRRFATACRDRAGDLLPHMSTANTARDLDLIRQALGEPTLTYYGLSYGTFLGATYANLFPGRIRAMVLDAVLEPVAYTTGRGGEGRRLSTALRLKEDVERRRVFSRFLDLCAEAGPSRCPFAAAPNPIETGRVETRRAETRRAETRRAETRRAETRRIEAARIETRRKYAELTARLAKGPIRAGDDVFTRATTMAAVAQAMDVVEPLPGYVDHGWPQAARLLQTLWLARNTPIPAAPQQKAPEQNPVDRYAGLEQAGAVVCADTDRPAPATFPGQAEWAARRSGDFGRLATWRLAPCSVWPTMDADRYTGPWNRRTAAPILVMSTTYDPADPYHNAQRLTRELSRARLLTVDGYGHGVILNPSTCADRHQTAYLINGTLPPEGTVCTQDAAPFQGVR
ncbi:alpha/beta hydrolase [Nonomuraea typhae]|uniref:alpha/beta hydrolase n=1 Tax=Nonomuraea typhae TaxID=2603600 RepID=UPI0012F7EB7F|nr:alpha/beta hydrolase [Nonomuraea typhae]